MKQKIGIQNKIVDDLKYTIIDESNPLEYVDAFACLRLFLTKKENYPIKTKHKRMESTYKMITHLKELR